MNGTISNLSHHVYFWLKNPESKDDLAKLIAGVKTLNTIETIKGFHIATPAATEERGVIDSSYSVSWLAFFDNEEGKITHVGILLDNERIIHASGCVKIDKFDHYGIFNSNTKKYSHTLS